MNQIQPRYEHKRIEDGYAVVDSETGRRVTAIFRDVWSKAGVMQHPGAKKRARKIARRWNQRAA